MSVAMYPSVGSFKTELLGGVVKTGMFMQSGSVLSVEIASRSGLDYVLLDQEHGLGSADVLLGQLTALAGTRCFPVVRLPCLEAAQFKKVLDAGALPRARPCCRIETTSL
jgi:2-keto-3-deoxy-L-rhamnonate aldolase RhmA